MARSGYVRTCRWVQGEPHGGKREGAGRKRKLPEEKVHLVSLYLTAEQREYLLSWGCKPSEAGRRLIERSMKFWPKGE